MGKIFIKYSDISLFEISEELFLSHVYENEFPIKEAWMTTEIPLSHQSSCCLDLYK